MNNDSNSAGVGPALRHLKCDDIELLIRRYYEGERVAELLTAYSIPCTAGQLAAQFPPEVLRLGCRHCGAPLHRRRVSRTMRWQKPAYCPACDHVETPNCECHNCKDQEARRSQARRQLIAAAIEDFCSIKNAAKKKLQVLSDLAPEAAIALLALVRTADVRGDGTLVPLAKCSIPFSPTEVLSHELLSILQEERLLWIDPASSPDAFEMQDVTVKSIKSSLIAWRLPDPVVMNLLRELEGLGIRRALPPHWMEEAHRLHQVLAASECRAYFDHCLTERRLPYNRSAKVDAMIDNLLIDFSVSQAMRIIWGGVQWTSDFLAREQVTRVHASNYAIGACQRWADRARAERWTVTSYRRPYALPRSMLSYVLHDAILNIGDRGFYFPGCEIWPDEPEKV